MLVFAFSLFVSAFLLFWVEPLIAKMLLPQLGGAPAVWNTCMVFFQTILLLGYLYAHCLTRWLSLFSQQLLHTFLLITGLLLIPISLNTYWHIDVNAPITSLFIQLILCIGVPIFLLSATAPLLQRWFSQSTHQHAADPYFLYSYSNLGSILALVSFPVLLEPLLDLQQQSLFWAVGYAGLLLSFGIILLITLRQKTAISSREPEHEIKSDRAIKNVTRFYWVLLAFVPSSLLLGVTTALTTDVAAVPLLWVVPLALYLLSFIIVFSRSWYKYKNVMRYILNLQLVLLFLFVFVYTFPYHFNYLSVRFIIHLTLFFVTALVCHNQLVAARPHSQNLTEFYLWIALGGVLGGLFNTLIAPVFFTSIAEYPLVLSLACLLRPKLTSRITIFSWWEIVLPLSVFIVLSSAAWLAIYLTGNQQLFYSMILLYGLAAVMIFSFPERRWYFALGIAALLFSTLWFIEPFNNNILYAERNFFGAIKVVGIKYNRIHGLMHGTTLHGAEDMLLAKKHILLTYYQPIQHILQVKQQQLPSIQVAIAGLGTGTIACMARSSDQMHFYEINPAIIALANNPQYFTYLQQCPLTSAIRLGDARLQLARAKPQQYDVIILDAFSSDAIPIHLLTKEALQLYLSKLKPHGLLAFNITNNFLDLKPILASGAKTLGLIGFSQFDRAENPKDDLYFASSWVIMARNREDMTTLITQPSWQPLTNEKTVRVWTDSYSNIFAAMIG